MLEKTECSIFIQWNYNIIMTRKIDITIRDGSDFDTLKRAIDEITKSELKVSVSDKDEAYQKAKDEIVRKLREAGLKVTVH